MSKDKRDLIKELQKIKRKQLTQLRLRLKSLNTLKKSANNILDALLKEVQNQIQNLQH